MPDIIFPGDDEVFNPQIGDILVWNGTGWSAIVNGLSKDNTDSFTPDSDYEPATKKYVDEAVGVLDHSHANLTQLNLLTVGNHDVDVLTNPHQIDQDMVGLANVDNTADANKPISSDVTSALSGKISTTEKGSAGGVADLDGSGLVPISQMPSIFLDGIEEYADLGSFPGTGEANKLYYAIDTGLLYRWSGSAYVELEGGGVALGETSGTAYRGDRGKIAYDHSLDTDNPHTISASTLTLGNVDNTSDADKPVSTDGIAALALKADDADLTTHEADQTNPHVVTADQVDCLKRTNTTEFTPNSDYHPATKKYVDDRAGAAISLTPTPSVDLKGGGATASVLSPYNFMRPSGGTEPPQTIIDRTAAIQAAIDAVSASGPGEVILPAGLYQCNQIVLDSRVTLRGQGEGKTTLLDAGNDTRPANNLGFITTRGYEAFQDQYDIDSHFNNIPKWYEDGAVVKVELYDLTIDGNGFTIGSSPEWDFTPGAPNLGKGYVGLNTYVSGFKIDRVRIINCDGFGMVIQRGGEGRNGPYTPIDDPSTQIGAVEIQSCNGGGCKITSHPDGTIKRLNISDCGDLYSKPGYINTGQFWHIQSMHVWACYYGATLYGTQWYDWLEVEFCDSHGLRVLPLGNPPHHSGAIINELVLFNNARETGRYAYIDEPIDIRSCFVDMQEDTTPQEAGKTGFYLTENAAGSRIRGRVVNNNDDPPIDNTFLDMISVADGGCTISLSGDARSVKTTILKMRGDSPGNTIDLKFDNLDDADTKLLVSEDGASGDLAVIESNRVRLWYDTGELADVDAYFAGVSNWPQVELNGYAFQDGVPLSLIPTPAADLRGPSATSPLPYDNLRPSEVESAQTILDRTAIIQSSIDTAETAGGGKVVLPAGLFQINQIELKDRVALIGQGESKTVLLDAGNDVRVAQTKGTDDTSSSAAFLTDTTQSWTPDALIGLTVYNGTDGSSAVITDNDGTTVTGTLTGGTTNLWNSGDKWYIYSLLGMGLVTTQDYGTFFARCSHNPATTPKWRDQGGVGKVEIRELTIDGNGFEQVLAETEWDIANGISPGGVIAHPNEGTGYQGISAFGSGTIIDNIRVVNTDGNAIDIWNGSMSKSTSHYTSADCHAPRLGKIEIKNTNDAGLRIRAHPDGALERLLVSGCKNEFDKPWPAGTGLIVQGSWWGIGWVHSFGNMYGIQNYGSSHYGFLECEWNLSYGVTFQKYGFLGGGMVDSMSMFNNQREGLGEAYVVVKDFVQIGKMIILVQDESSTSTVERKGLTFSGTPADWVGTNIKGRIIIDPDYGSAATPPTAATLVDMEDAYDVTLDVVLEGSDNDVDITGVHCLGTEQNNKIDIRAVDFGGSGTNMVLDTSSVALDKTNRARVWYDSSIADVDAYFAGSSICPQVTLNGYASDGGAVVVEHITGGRDVYGKGLLSDVERGTALIAAADAGVAGDVLKLTAGNYDIGGGQINLPNDVSLSGLGQKSTTIEGVSVTNVLISPGDNSLIEGFTITGISGSSAIVIIGANNTSAGDKDYSGAIVRDVAMYGYGDVYRVHMQSGGANDQVYDITFENCYLTSTFDVANINGSVITGCTHHYEFKGCKLEILNPATYSRGIVLEDGFDTATATIRDTFILCEESGVFSTSAVKVEENSTVDLHNTTIRVGKNDDLLTNDATGTINVYGGTGSGPGGSFLATNTAGTINYNMEFDGQPLPLVKTPADDRRGGGASAPDPYINMRPSETESAGVITARTLVLQNAIDAASAAGGGRVVFGAGLFQFNQIIMKSRVTLEGQGMGKTVLLAASGMTSDEGFITSENFNTWSADPSNAPKWAEDGALTRMSIRELSVDGHGHVFGLQSIWDYTPDAPNTGNNVHGITLLGSGIWLDNVHVSACSGDAVQLWRGGLGRGNDDVSEDDSVNKVGLLQVSQCDGDGLHCYKYADGYIQRLKAWELGGAGLIMDGGAWHVNNVHAFSVEYGCINYAQNFFGTLEVEGIRNTAFVNATGSDKTTIERLRCFDCSHVPQNGTHVAGAASAYLYVGGGSWSGGWLDDSEVGKTITNLTNGETATITSNTASTIVGTLSGGETWDVDDEYAIGTHTGGAAADDLTDSTATWRADMLVGLTITNLDNDASAIITANTETTITANLSGSETWDPGDPYKLSNVYVLLIGDCRINHCDMSIQDKPNRTGFVINNGANATKIHGNIAISNGTWRADGAICVDQSNWPNAGDARLDINIGGWAGSVDDITVMKFLGGSKGSRIDLSYAGFGAGTNMLLDSLATSGANWYPHSSNRIRLAYDQGTIPDAEAIYFSLTGTATADHADLTDAAPGWTANGLIGGTVINKTTGETGYITDNTTTTVQAALSNGGTWTIDDDYEIRLPQLELMPY